MEYASKFEITFHGICLLPICKTNFKKYDFLGVHGLDEAGSRLGKKAGCRECGNVTSGSIKYEEFLHS